jgi:hypothetical protein
MLFVQNEGPPKCLYRYVGPEDKGAIPAFMSPYQLKWFRHAARWWIVECENADAGRLAISLQTLRASGPAVKLLMGTSRILASGSK